MNASTKENVMVAYRSVCIGMGFSTLQGTITHRALFYLLGYLELLFLDESLGPIEFLQNLPRDSNFFFFFKFSSRYFEM